MNEQELPPRPWEARFDGAVDEWQFYGKDAAVLFASIWVNSDLPEERLARLWAAAPELAEALEQFAHFIDIDLRAIIARDNRDEDERREIWIELVMNAQAALARARGEAVAR